MTAPASPAGPRPRRPAWRVLAWSILIVGTAVLLAWFGAQVVRAARRTLGFGGPVEPTITHQAVVERVRDVAKIVATEMTLRDVVIYEHTRFGSTKRALLVVTGKVSAGIDLTGGADVSIDSAAKRISIAVPPAQIIGVDVLDITTYDESAGLLNPFRPEDRDTIHRRIRTQLILAARRSGLLEHADESTTRLLQELLGRDGYTVDVRRPVVRRAPAG